LYKITIERTRTVPATLGHDWKVVGQDADGKDKYGYTPEYEGERTEYTDLYVQRVDELDVAAVVAVVNGIHATNGQLAPA
jgi:hypothetical protein